MRSLNSTGLVLLMLLLAPAVTVFSEQDPPLTAEQRDAMYKKGATSYRKRCARCHGVNMVNPGAGIFDLRTFPKDGKERFVDVVTNGRNAMPSWGALLQPADIDMLWIYVTTAQASAP